MFKVLMTTHRCFIEIFPTQKNPNKTKQPTPNMRLYLPKSEAGREGI